MNKGIIVAILFMIARSTTVFGDDMDSRFPQAREYLHSNGMAITTTIEKSHLQNAILVMGEGLPIKGSVGGQKRLTALTAAKVVAQRRLAELLEGVTIVSGMTVGESQRHSESIKTTVTGFVRGAQPVVQEWNAIEETALVILKVGITGPKSIAAAMYEKVLNDRQIVKELDKPAYSVPEMAPAALVTFDGLIIDATEYEFRPALINRIFTPAREVLYDPARISQKVLVEQGCGEYSTSIDKARAALGRRAVRNPLIVRASGIFGPSDLQVSDATAAQIYSANKGSGFMADARVAFVLK